MGRKPALTEAERALEHLMETRIPAFSAYAEAAAEEERLGAQLVHLDTVASRFVRRRDHLRAAAEADPAQSRQAVELADTAERLRQGVGRLRKGLIASAETAAARTHKAAAAVARIDTALARLSDAVKSLELVKLEQANEQRLTALERSRLDRAARPSSLQPPGRTGAAPADLEFHVREVNRLAYEAEALAELQRERLS